MEIFFYSWNLNSVSAHDFSNASLLKAMATYKQYDIICLSETFPDSSIERTDNRLNIQWYNLMRPYIFKKKNMNIVYTNKLNKNLQSPGA